MSPNEWAEIAPQLNRSNGPTRLDSYSLLKAPSINQHPVVHDSLLAREFEMEMRPSMHSARWLGSAFEKKLTPP
jgi:hypothetical protein